MESKANKTMEPAGAGGSVHFTPVSRWPLPPAAHAHRWAFMNSRTLILAACALLVSAFIGKPSDLPVPSANLHTVFVERGVLSPTEVSNVVALARKCGLENPASIQTYYFQPISRDWNFGIEVKGAERVSGRWISCITVDVFCHEAAPESKMQSLGKFWVAPGEVRTNEFATFAVSNQTIRVKMPRSVPLATADRILAAFAAKRVQYPEGQEFLRETIEKEDFSTPNQLEGPAENGAYKASKGGLSGWELEFALKGDKVKIIRISSFRS